MIFEEEDHEESQIVVGAEPKEDVDRSTMNLTNVEKL